MSVSYSMSVIDRFNHSFLKLYQYLSVSVRCVYQYCVSVSVSYPVLVIDRLKHIKKQKETRKLNKPEDLH